MNAIIALCHFCDYHGPRTLFCTQAFKYADFQQHQKQQQQQQQQRYSELSSNAAKNNRNNINNNNNSNNIAAENNINTDKVEFVLDPAPPESLSPNLSSINRFNIEQQNLTNISSSPSSASTHSLSPKTSGAATAAVNNNLESTNSTCKACRAFEKAFHYYISYDDSSLATTTTTTTALSQTTTTPASNTSESSTSSTNGGGGGAHICYLSQSTPSDSEVFALVRKACLRTLHCEVFEDPIYFDDDKNGSVIGYEFNIKDSEGRGFQRSYSLIIIMKDRMYLQHLWSFLSKQMAIIASNIKLEAERKFVKDMGEKDLAPPMIINTSGGSASGHGNDQAGLGFGLGAYSNDQQQQQQPQQPQQKQWTLTSPSTSYTTHSSYQRQTLYTKKKATKQVRGLIELTDDPMIFAKLHMWFTWILRMSSCQITEEFVHGK
jgi:hypothetical protein